MIMKLDIYLNEGVIADEKTPQHPEETSKNSDNCDFSKVSDIAKALESMED